MDKYIIALYLRLSLDERLTDSVSIETQRKILRDYAERLGIDNIEIIEFVDNGYSGTSFERPAVQELLELVKSYKVNCVMVKDFSRFGRNSIEVGYFTQQVFPLFNVRFISVSDNFDSDNCKGDTGGLEVAFKYLVNEYYSRDLSKKSRSAKYVKMRSGEYKSGNYCYGYISGANGEMVIDEYAADVVCMIFRLSSEGKTAPFISNVLYEKGILTPGQYKAQRGKNGHDLSRCSHWTTSTIVRLLGNEQYTGMFVMCRKRVAEVGSTKMIDNAEDDWIKIPDHHPAIISRELYDKVQSTRLTFKNPDRKEHTYPLKGKVFCGCCKHAMQKRNKKIPVYVCYYTKDESKSAPCYRMELQEEELHNIIFEIITKQAQLITAMDSVSDLDALRLKTEQTIELEKQIKELKDAKQRLYEQLLMREIDMEEYTAEKRKADEKLQTVQSIYNQACMETEQMKIDSKTKADMIRLAQDISKEHTLTQTLSDMLIDKVFVYPDRRIEISWKVQDFCRDYAENI